MSKKAARSIKEFSVVVGIELAAAVGLADLEGEAPRRSGAGSKQRAETRETGRQ